MLCSAAMDGALIVYLKPLCRLRLHKTTVYTVDFQWTKGHRIGALNHFFSPIPEIQRNLGSVAQEKKRISVAVGNTFSSFTDRVGQWEYWNSLNVSPYLRTILEVKIYLIEGSKVVSTKLILVFLVPEANKMSAYNKVKNMTLEVLDQSCRNQECAHT